MIKAALAKAGKGTARLYISTLWLVIFVFPLIFCGGFIFAGAMIADGLGVGHLGLTGLFLFVGASLLGVLFFSVFAWPHVSSEVGRALDALGVGGSYGGT